MNELMAAELGDVTALVEREWLAHPDEIRDVVGSRFSGRPEVEGPTFEPDGRHVGWFVFYGPDGSIVDEHRAFCAAVSAALGPPVDETSTTATWRYGTLVIESYAHVRGGRDPHSSHQLGITSTGVVAGC